MSGPIQLGLPFSAPAPERRASLVGMATSEEKLRGEVYTPLAVADGMAARLAWPTRGARLLDPSCGDGVFLEAALRRLAALDLGRERAARIAAAMEGWDVHPPALAAARERLEAAGRTLGLPTPRLVRRDALDGLPAAFDAVLGNPPYLEAKRMPPALKAQVQRTCPVAATGAFDLYGAFVERAFSFLPDGGELCLIVPNRFLVTAYAQPLRALLLAEGRVCVVDLSEAQVFADAAVYPVVVYATRGGPPAFSVETWEGAAGAWELPAAALRSSWDALMPLPPRHPGARTLLPRLLADERFSRFDARFDARWTVSFHKAGLRDLFTFPEKPDSPHARPFLGGGRFQGNREVDGYRIAHGGWWIDYDEARARASGNPLPDPAIFAGPKVVLCQNARRGRAALDPGGGVLKDTFLAIKGVPALASDTGVAEAAWLAWLVLWLNSDLFHFLYEHLYGGTRKGGAFLHFLPRYLAPLPLAPPPAGEDPRALLEAVQADLGARAAVERLLRHAWGVTPAEAEALDAYGYPDDGRGKEGQG